MSLLFLLALQVATPDTARIRQQLPEVEVRAQHRILVLQAPGETKGIQTAFGRELTPTTAVAVWHGPPDTSRVYVVRAMRVHLGSRFPKSAKELPKARRNFSEGTIRLWLSPGSPSGGPRPDQNLLAAPLLLTAETPAPKGWVRFEVADQRLVLPAQGLFVVAEGEPVGAETYVRTRSLVRPLNGKTSPEDVDFTKIRPGKGVTVFRYVELRRPDGTVRLAAVSEFPSLAHRLTERSADCYTWVRRLKHPDNSLRWQSIPQDLAPMRAAMPDVSTSDYNYELELEVEEL